MISFAIENVFEIISFFLDDLEFVFVLKHVHFLIKCSLTFRASILGSKSAREMCFFFSFEALLLYVGDAISCPGERDKCLTGMSLCRGSVKSRV